MNKKLFEALISVSQTSTSAKKLAEQLLAENSTETVKSLYDKIHELERKLSEISATVSEPETLSEDDERDLLDKFSNSVSKDDWSTLLQYTRPYMKMFPRVARPVIATVLCNKARELDKEPLEIWLDVLALNAEIK